MDRTSHPLHGWRLAPLALPMFWPLWAAAAEARAPTDPAAIDRAVAAFTGAAPGTPGGARTLSDPRLQLAPCDAALAVSWHSPARSSVRVECPGPAGWRVFVAIAAASGGANTTQGRTATAVKRGDALSVMVRGRGFSVQQPGEAMESGAVGDWIFVRTNRKAEGLRARIERPGLAVVPAG